MNNPKQKRKLYKTSWGGAGMPSQSAFLVVKQDLCLSSYQAQSNFTLTIKNKISQLKQLSSSVIETREVYKQDRLR